MNEEEQKVNVKVKRHQWPDEIDEYKKNKKSKLTTLIIVAIGFFILGTVFSNSLPTIGTKADNSKYNLIEQIMTSEWYFGKDVEDIETFIKDKGFYGLTEVEEYDLHTTYMSKEEIESYSTKLSGSFVGIGIQYSQTDPGTYMIQRVIPDSPAEKSGLQAGDILVSVAGVATKDLSTDEIVELVMGEKGTPVSIGLLRSGEEITKEVIRDEVLNSIRGEVVDEDTAYLKLDQFGESTATEVLRFLERIEGKQSKLIVDLRDNGGGYLNSVIDIVGYFVENDSTVLITKNRDGKETEEKTTLVHEFEFDDIVILVNEHTASASEVFTAALKEHLEDHVTVVGTNSYGKGTVQQTKMFSDNSALKYTTAEWLSPSGKAIHGVGIKPDVEVNLHLILKSQNAKFEDVTSFELDSVGYPVSVVQMALDFLGYTVDRQDGYFDPSTDTALRQLQKDLGLKEDGIINEAMVNASFQRVIREWTLNPEKYDTQYNEAIKIIKES